MLKNTKQIIVLDNLSSPYIEQAIFIMKELPADAAKGAEVSAVREAEKIVSDYLKRYESPCAAQSYAKKHKERRSAKIPVFLFVMAAVSLLGILSAVIMRL